MRRTVAAVLLVLGCVLPVAQPSPAIAAAPVPPLARAHAHNDYEHPRPLRDALDNGFTSVEADIWLVDGALLVAHDRDQVRPERTLQRLYLTPLAERVRAGHGSVYPGWRHPVHLLIDVKSEAAPTYAVLHRVLARYAGMLTVFTPRHVSGGAVTATVSGNRDLPTMAAQRVRYAGYDGRLADVGARASLIPLVSDNYSTVFGWRGVGPMPPSEKDRLAAIVRTAHAHGQRVRFWETPDDPGLAREHVWRELLRAGVDYLNTDHLADLAAFLRAYDPHPSSPAVPWWRPRG